MKITTLEQAQHYITMNEDKWAKIRHILKYLGINNTEIMKPQEKMLEKWIMEFNFPIPVIEEACNRCFKRLNRAEFKYIDGILSNWNKNNLKFSYNYILISNFLLSLGCQKSHTI